MKSVNPEDLAKEITRMVNKWDAKVDIAVDQSVAETTKQAKSEIKKHSPRKKRGSAGGGTFRQAFVIKTISKKHKVIWNKEYQLAHLLEDGHEVYNRPPHTKYKIGVGKRGPFKIHTLYTSDKNAKHQKPDKTSKYEMFKITYDFADTYLREDIVARLKKIGRL